jgi:PAS domain S-box-containing protein
MNPARSSLLIDTAQEVAALIDTLHATERRLEELTQGEVDTVSDRDGRMFMLRRAQEELRLSEAAKQTAILNALPAQIALLDRTGIIVSMNKAWSRFAGAHVLQDPASALSANYLAMCDAARGDGASTAKEVGAGIRSVLDGSEKSFSIEYSCDPPTEPRCFRLTVTPLTDDRQSGAVVTHLDVTAERQAAQSLRESERRFSDLLGNVELVSLMLDREARMTYCNEYLLRLTGWRREEVIGRNWFEVFVPPEADDRKGVFAALIANEPGARHHENEILTRSGGRRDIRWSNSVLRSGAGDVIGTASVGEDITERKLAEEVLAKRAADLEHFHRLSVGRELQMIELKKQINESAEQAGRAPPYDLAFLSREAVNTRPRS